MKIDRIEIINYKAFIGIHEISVKGKNLFIYGENGSGKNLGDPEVFVIFRL